MSLPLSYKINKGVSKWGLRELLYKYVPKELINRPKMGFSVPLDEWLSGPLREWAESLISIERLSNEGYLNPILVRSKWDDTGVAITTASNSLSLIVILEISRFQSPYLKPI